MFVYKFTNIYQNERWIIYYCDTCKLGEKGRIGEVDLGIKNEINYHNNIKDINTTILIDIT